MRTDEEMVAYALEVDPQLLPYIDELLADLEELGSDAIEIAAVLEDLGVDVSSSVIDLGSGKGYCAVEIADETGALVTGIELFEPFVISSRELAETADVADRVTFIHGNIGALAGTLPPADAIVFAAMGDVLGPLDETVGIIRQYVKPGGYMVISDVFVKPGGNSDYPGFENYAPHAATQRRLTAHGDVLLREILGADDDEEDDEDEDEVWVDEVDLIRQRAATVASQHPEMAAAIEKFVESQAAEGEFIDENMTDALWVLRRT